MHKYEEHLKRELPVQISKVDFENAYNMFSNFKNVNEPIMVASANTCRCIKTEAGGLILSLGPVWVAQ